MYAERRIISMKKTVKKNVLAVLLVFAMAVTAAISSPMGGNGAKAAGNMSEAIDLATTFTKTFVLGVSDTVQSVAMPVTFSKNVYSQVKVTFAGAQDMAFCSISKQAEFSKNVSDYMDIFTTEKGNTITTTYTQSDFSGKGSLYLVLLKSKYDMNREVTVTLEVTAADATAGGTLKKGQKTTSVNTDGRDQYYKLTLSGAGKVTIKTDCRLALCSSAKKELQDIESSPKGTTLILDKGTYYLKNGNKGITNFSYTYKKVSLPANRTKGKAKIMKFGKKVSGIFPFGSKGYWYKLKVGSNRKIKTKYVLSKTLADSYINVVIYKKNKKVLWSANSEGKKGSLYYWTKDGKPKLAKGNYLVKVKPSAETGFGTFSLTMK